MVQFVLPILNPKAYLPVHWNGLWGAFLSMVSSRYHDSRSLASRLARSGVKLLKPVQSMDKWRLARANRPRLAGGHEEPLRDCEHDPFRTGTFSCTSSSFRCVRSSRS